MRAAARCALMMLAFALIDVSSIGHSFAQEKVANWNGITSDAERSEWRESLQIIEFSSLVPAAGIRWRFVCYANTDKQKTDLVPTSIFTGRLHHFVSLNIHAHSPVWNVLLGWETFVREKTIGERKCLIPPFIAPRPKSIERMGGIMESHETTIYGDIFSNLFPDVIDFYADSSADAIFIAGNVAADIGRYAQPSSVRCDDSCSREIGGLFGSVGGNSRRLIGFSQEYNLNKPNSSEDERQKGESQSTQSSQRIWFKSKDSFVTYFLICCLSGFVFGIAASVMIVYWTSREK